MPVYEYRCHKCHARFSVLVRGFTQTPQPRCSCGSSDLEKLISRCTVLRSEESRLDDLADPGRLGDLDENDPKSIARWARKLGKEAGEDLGPEFDEAVARLEAGEMPDEAMGGVDSEPEGSPPQEEV